MEIILASGSPRRKELLEMLGVKDFKIIPAKGEEKDIPGATPDELVKALSLAKATEVSKEHKDSLIIAADTIVWHNNKVLGKPSSKENAFEMLSSLSGKTHEVYTGVSLILEDRILSQSVMSSVTFKNLSEDEINAYIETGEPMDKAGAYGAQGKAALFVEKINGDFFNVMGLPLCTLGQMLEKLGVKLL